MKTIKMIALTSAVALAGMVNADTILKNNVHIGYGAEHSSDTEKSAITSVGLDILLTERMYTTVGYQNNNLETTSNVEFKNEQYDFGIGYEKKFSNSEHYDMSVFYEMGFGFMNMENKTMDTEDNKSSANIGIGLRNKKDAFQSEMKYSFNVSDLDDKHEYHVLSGQLMMDIEAVTIGNGLSVGAGIKTNITDNKNEVNALVQYRF